MIGADGLSYDTARLLRHLEQLWRETRAVNPSPITTLSFSGREIMGRSADAFARAALAMLPSPELGEVLKDCGDTYEGMPTIDYLKIALGIGYETLGHVPGEGRDVYYLGRERDASVIIVDAMSSRVHGAFLCRPRYWDEDGNSFVHDDLCTEGVKLLVAIGYEDGATSWRRTASGNAAPAYGLVPGDVTYVSEEKADALRRGLSVAWRRILDIDPENAGHDPDVFTNALPGLEATP